MNVAEADPRGRRGEAAALAERLERFCATAIKHRIQGRCKEPGVSDREHIRLGHDAGCRALGTPRRAVAYALRTWDRVGAAELLIEAIDEAIEALSGCSRVGSYESWSPQLASECVTYAIWCRITPRVRWGAVLPPGSKTPRP